MLQKPEMCFLMTISYCYEPFEPVRTSLLLLLFFVCLCETVRLVGLVHLAKVMIKCVDYFLYARPSCIISNNKPAKDFPCIFLFLLPTRTVIINLSLRLGAKSSGRMTNSGNGQEIRIACLVVSNSINIAF